MDAVAERGRLRRRDGAHWSSRRTGCGTTCDQWTTRARHAGHIAARGGSDHRRRRSHLSLALLALPRSRPTRRASNLGRPGRPCARGHDAARARRRRVPASRSTSATSTIALLRREHRGPRARSASRARRCSSCAVAALAGIVDGGSAASSHGGGWLGGFIGTVLHEPHRRPGAFLRARRRRWSRSRVVLATGISAIDVVERGRRAGSRRTAASARGRVARHPRRLPARAGAAAPARAARASSLPKPIPLVEIDEDDAARRRAAEGRPAADHPRAGAEARAAEARQAAAHRGAGGAASSRTPTACRRSTLLDAAGAERRSPSTRRRCSRARASSRRSSPTSASPARSSPSARARSSRRSSSSRRRASR